MTRKAFVWIGSSPSDGALTFYWTMFNTDGSIYGAPGSNYPLTLSYSDNPCSLRDQITTYLQTYIDVDHTCFVELLP